MSSRVTETPTTSRATNRWLILVAGVLVQFTSVPLISVAAGSASDVGYSTAAAASLVGVLGLFNGGGRISWGWLSDRIGKMPAFMGILGPGVCLLLIPHVASPDFFAVAVLVCTCYGGAFGRMPSTARRFFGVRNAGAIYELMLIG